MFVGDKCSIHLKIEITDPSSRISGLDMTLLRDWLGRYFACNVNLCGCKIFLLLYRHAYHIHYKPKLSCFKISNKDAVSGLYPSLPLCKG